MNEKELQAALDASQAPKGVKAEAWDAFQQVKSPDEFKKRFDGLVLPKETKAKLWDLKFPSHGSPSRSFIPKGSGAGTAKSIPGADLPIKRTLSSLAEGLGLPRNEQELEAMKPSTAEVIGGPAVTAGKMAYRAGKNAFQSMTAGLKEGEEASENISKGQPIGQNIGKAAYGAVKGITGALSPIGAEEPVKFGEDIAKGDYASAAGHGIATVVNALLLKGKEPFARESKLTYATGAHPEDIKMVIGDLDKTAAQKGIKVNTIGDLQTLGKETTNSINQEFSLALQPIANQRVVGTSIADAIRAKITPNMSQTAQGRQMEKLLRARAVEFDKDWTMRQLDQERMDATARNRSYHKAEASGQRARLRDNVDNIVDKAIEDGTKDLVYSAMDRANNKPTGYFENLKRRQSSLIDFNDQVKKQVERLQKDTATQKGSPFFKKHGIHTYGHPESGRIGTSMHRIETIFTDPETSASRVAKKGMKKAPAISARQAAVFSLPARMLSMPNFGELTPLPEDDSSE